eukprot:scaffold64366_cov28-Prasinocladus_malaysianus.AAC.2
MPHQRRELMGDLLLSDFQIAQQKVGAHQLELERKSAAITEMQKELERRQGQIQAAEQKAADAHANLCAVAEAARATKQSAAALEGRLEDGANKMAELMGRVLFAERRMK